MPSPNFRLGCQRCGGQELAHKVGECQGCGRRVCRSCWGPSMLTIYSPLLCPDCRAARRAEQIQEQRR